jgi:hypothetical protein
MRWGRIGTGLDSGASLHRIRPVLADIVAKVGGWLLRRNNRIAGSKNIAHQRLILNQ